MLKKLNITHYNIFMVIIIVTEIFQNIYHQVEHMMMQIKLSELFEVTYINKNICEKTLVEIKEIQFLTVLDYPNNRNVPDIYFSIPIDK